jgi:hypothetical protein
MPRSKHLAATSRRRPPFTEYAPQTLDRRDDVVPVGSVGALTAAAPGPGHGDDHGRDDHGRNHHFSNIHDLDGMT